jgi:hypothetical protein
LAIFTKKEFTPEKNHQDITSGIIGFIPAACFILELPSNGVGTELAGAPGNQKAFQGPPDKDQHQPCKDRVAQLR